MIKLHTCKHLGKKITGTILMQEQSTFVEGQKKMIYMGWTSLGLKERKIYRRNKNRRKSIGKP